jgi:hypothetical protein
VTKKNVTACTHRRISFVEPTTVYNQLKKINEAQYVPEKVKIVVKPEFHKKISNEEC